MQNNQFLKVKNSLLELEKDVTKLKDRENCKIEIKKTENGIEKLFRQPITLSKDDADKFEEQKMKKIRQMIRNWFGRLIKQNVMILRNFLKQKKKNQIEEKRSKMKK